MKEVAKHKFDQIRYDPSVEIFDYFLNKCKKVAKQAFRDRSEDIFGIFLFAKLPVQMQNELAMAAEHNDTMEQIPTFVQRRCQYAQLQPATSNAHSFNRINQPQPPTLAPQNTNTQTQPNREVKRKFDRQCSHCGIHGHKWAECRIRFQEESRAKPANQNPQHTAQPNQTQENKPKYNSKLVCKICCKVGHSARDCYHRNTTQSAYRNVSYPKQSTDENKQFRRDFRQANNRTYKTNEAEDSDEIERHDAVKDRKNF